MNRTQYFHSFGIVVALYTCISYFTISYWSDVDGASSDIRYESKMAEKNQRSYKQWSGALGLKSRLTLLERVHLAQPRSEIYVSLLTTSKYHDGRLSFLFVTWMQTLNPKQVHVITDGDGDMWTTALNATGFSVIFSNCPQDRKKTKGMMCCKGGAQFDNWYKAIETGETYNWYCHFDDDIYLNTKALIEVLSKYDSTQLYYLGKWKRLSKQLYDGQDRISGNVAPGLTKFPERKKNDFRYANGPAYCISAALMVKLESYLRGPRFIQNCRRANVVMDDILPGVVIEGILGVEITDIPEITDQMDYPPYDDDHWYKQQITVAYQNIYLPHGKFSGSSQYVEFCHRYSSLDLQLQSYIVHH